MMVPLRKIRLAFGFIILLATVIIGAISYRRVLYPLLYQYDIEISKNEATVVGFRVNSTGSHAKLYIYLDVYPMVVEFKKEPPLLAIVIVDEEGLYSIENNQTPSYIYIRAVGIENSTVFELKDLRPGVYYLIISNAIPERAKLKVTVVNEWGESLVDYRLLYLLALVGLILVLSGLIFNWIPMMLKSGRTRFRKSFGTNHRTLVWQLV